MMKRKKLNLSCCVFGGLLWAMLLLESLRCCAADEISKIATPLQWGEESNGFRLAVFFEKTNFVTGEKVVAHSILKNASSEPHGVLDGNTQIEFKNTLKDADGKNVPFTDYGKWLEEFGSSTWLSPHLINSGEAEKRDFPVSKVYDLKIPGKYVFVAVRRVPSLTNTNIAENMKWYGASVTSNPAIFYITNEQEKKSP